MSNFPRSACLWPKNSVSHGLMILLAFPIFSVVAAAADLTVSPTAEDFGTINVGTSLTQTVTLTNKGNSTIKVSNVAVYGAGFSVKDVTTPLILSARETSSFEVRFTPQIGVSSSGGLVIVNNAGSPLRVTLSGVGWVPVSGSVPSHYLGLALHPEVLIDRVPWPSVPFGSVRLWDTQTQWSILNPSEGTYEWAELDSWLSMAAQNGKTDLLYTFGTVPQWASSNPNDPTCVSGNSGPGSCDPPSDLNADGTGTDKYWKDFVTALVSHAAGRIKYWEIWNEPDCPYEWSGTNAQLVRMAKDAYAIIKAADPTAMVTTPSSVDAGSGHSIDIWLPAYLAAGGDAYADLVAFHGYVNPALGQQPEDIAKTVDRVTSSITGSALAKTPIWNSEGGWTSNTNLPDPDMQAAFVARVYLLQWFKGVSRFYWFQYGNADTGTLWTPEGGPNEAEIAYGQVYGWLLNATLTGPCAATGSVWTCSYTKADGVKQQAVWDASKTCNNGHCTTSSYTPDTVYNRYADLAGNVTAFTPGTTIKIGAKPILLEN